MEALAAYGEGQRDEGRGMRGEGTFWHVYIVRCTDDTLYTGITRDVERRVDEHNTSNLLAASYTRSRRPVTLVYREPAATRSAASTREYELKRMTRRGKETLIAGAEV